MYIDTHTHFSSVQIQKAQTRLYMRTHTNICIHKRTLTLIQTHTMHITHANTHVGTHTNTYTYSLAGILSK